MYLFFVIKKMFRSLSVVFMLLFLIGCVTTTQSPFTSKANVEDAVRKYVQLGLEYLKRNDLSRARKHLKHALELDEENASASAAIGLVYHEQGEIKMAEQAFVAALEFDSSYTRGMTYYGAFLFSQQRYEEALAQFKSASLDVDYEGRIQVFTNLALCHNRLGHSEEALKAYKTTLLLDRVNGQALSGITELFLEINDIDQAQHYYNRLVKLIRNDGVKHSPKSLWMGIQIARHFNSVKQERSLGLMLGSLYPGSEEYRLYKSVMTGK